MKILFQNFYSCLFGYKGWNYYQRLFYITISIYYILFMKGRLKMDGKKIIIGVLGIVLTLAIGGSVYLFATGQAYKVVNNAFIDPINFVVKNLTGKEQVIEPMKDSDKKDKLTDFDSTDPVEVPD